jgi:short-subunit dehydrogenase
VNRHRYGPWALVAGASDGIGAAFAQALAANGLNLVLVARREALLSELAQRLSDQYGIATRTVVANLTTRAGLDEVRASTEDIGMVVVNAANAPIAEFLELTPSQVDGMVDLNVRAAADLAHAFGARLTRRGRGGLILLSSVASLQGSALVAHYAATKAYLRVLAEGLWYEWRPYGVDVLACCPGLVATPTFARDHPTPGPLVPPAMDPADVARQALARLGRKPVMVPGWRNRAVAALVARVIPRGAAIALSSRQTAQMYGRLSSGPTG